jgi:pre-60S factor REI1
MKEKANKTTLESLRICLFCNKEHTGVKSCLDHMRIKHGFTILDIECLVNLKGLLAYIAERIQIGKLCLKCSKPFHSAERAQMHMMMKGHCMMDFEDDEEYEPFYDFSRQYRNLVFHSKAITGDPETEMTETQKAEERKIQKD